MALFFFSVCKEIKDIAQHTAVSLEKFGILASVAGHGGEFQVLNVKNLAEGSPGGPDFSGLVVIVTAFGTSVIQILHVASFVPVDCK